MKVNELASKLETYIAQMLKVREEVVGKIDGLQAQLATLQETLENVTIPEDAQVALQMLGVRIQELDDLHPDAELPVDPEEPVDPVEPVV